MDMSAKEFLDSIPNPNTKKCYRLGIKRFCEWFGKTPLEVLNMRKVDLTQRPEENLIDYRNRAKRFEKELEKFHSYLLDQEFAINTARYLCLGIRQLFRYFEMPIRLRSGSKVSKSVQTGRSFPLRIEHVRKMFEVADLRERVLLSMAVDLGLRVSDFISIKRSDLPSLDQTSPISFDLMTGKESMIAHGFLSEESAKLLRVYLPTLRENNDYLFPSNAENHISDEWINKLIKRLAEKTKISTQGKQLSFHCFRKMYLSAAIDSGCGLTAAKKMCGKAIPQSDDTYLTTVHLRKKFIQLKKFLTINEQPKVETEKVEALKSIVTKLQQELSEQKLITQTITEESLKIKKELQFLNDIITPIQPMLEFVNSFESPGALMEFLEAIKERSAIARQRAERMPKLTKKARELLHEAVSDIIQKESQRVKQLLSQKTGITNEDILQAAIQAAKESIEEEYGIEIGAKEEQ